MKIKSASVAFILLLTCILTVNARADEGFWTRTTHAISHDYLNFYSKKPMLSLGIGLSTAAILANTSLDQDIQNYYQDHLRSHTSNHIARIFKQFGGGNGNFIKANAPFFVYATGFGLGLAIPQFEPSNIIGRWSSRSLRAIIVGGPPVLLFQEVLGSDRPSNGNGSHWRPFKTDHGVSGHAFLGAIPFLTAAQMTNNVFAKAVLYGASTLTGLSRVNDNAHYFSQVILGWEFAYFATSSVSQSIQEKNFIIMPMLDTDGGAGLQMQLSLN